MTENRVLLISQVFYPDQVAVANLLTNLCSVLVKNETAVEVWCAQPSYTCDIRQTKHKIYNGISIYYLWSSNFHKDKFLGRVCNVLSFSLSTICKLLFSKEKSFVISHTTPPFLEIIISFICRIKKRRNIYLMLDIIPDGLIRLKKVSSKNIFIKLWQKLHLNAIKRCHKVVVIGRDMRDWLLSIYPEGSDKVIYIPLWQDEELIQPIPFTENPFIINYHLNNKFVVQYSGNMGLWNDMKTFGMAVNKEPGNVMFVFIGGGMRKKELIDSFDRQDPENALLIPFLPNTDYAYAVSACHAALVSLRKGMEGMAVPSKIIGIMAAGVPVIAMVPQNSEIAYIIEAEKCGYVINPGDINELIDAIEELKSDENLRKTMGTNGRKAFERKYTSRIIAEKYLSLIR